jgi:hypothetical protein
MDDSNHLLSSRVGDADDPHDALRERVTTAILALVFCLGLIGWLVAGR